MKKSLSIAMLIIGTIIGAGFASGREIVAMFDFKGALSPFIALVCGVLVFGFALLFLAVARKLQGKNTNAVAFGRLAFVADFVMILNSFIVLAGMLAGMDSLFGSVIADLRPLYSVFFAIVAIAIVYFGTRGIMRANSILVPLIIIVMVAVCSLSIDTLFMADVLSEDLLNALVYVAMNMYLVSNVLTAMSDVSRKQAVLASAIAALVISALVLLVITALASNPALAYAEMPVLMMAKGNPVLYILAITIIAASIFTTLLTALINLVDWMIGIVNDRLIAGIICATLAYCISLMGFKAIVATFYPIIGLFGILYTAVCATILIRTPSKRLGNHSTLRQIRSK